MGVPCLLTVCQKGTLPLFHTHSLQELIKLNPKNAHRVMVSEALLTHLVTDARMNVHAPFRDEILKRLAPVLSKVSDGVAKPAYTEAIKLTKAQQLGLVDPPKAVDSKQQRIDAYNKWLISPDSLGALEIDMVKAYRWENDLMSPEEDAEYMIELNERAEALERAGN